MSRGQAAITLVNDAGADAGLLEGDDLTARLLMILLEGAFDKGRLVDG